MSHMGLAYFFLLSFQIFVSLEPVSRAERRKPGRLRQESVSSERGESRHSSSCIFMFPGSIRYCFFKIHIHTGFITDPDKFS